MKVLLVDDHPLILYALQRLTERLGDDVAMTGASSAHEARCTLALDEGFDLVLLDLQLGADNGFDLLVELRERYPALPVVIVSGSDRAADVIRAIDLGAMGFVPKSASADSLFDALRLVLAGGIYVPAMSPGSDTAAAPFAPVPGVPPAPADVGLTPRQADVLGHLLQGKPNKLIAKELKLSVETVKDHVAAVLRALGVNSRTQAVLAVSQLTQQQGGVSPWRPN